MISLTSVSKEIFNYFKINNYSLKNANIFINTYYMWLLNSVSRTLVNISQTNINSMKLCSFDKELTHSRINFRRRFSKDI